MPRSLQRHVAKDAVRDIAAQALRGEPRELAGQSLRGESREPAAQVLGHALRSDGGAEASPTGTDFDRARQRADERLAALSESRRLSQANRGLRMILVATVFVVAISWAGSLGGQFIRLMQIQTLVDADQDALRVMCAVEPPTEHMLGLMHICETVAKGGAPGERVETAATEK